MIADVPDRYIMGPRGNPTDPFTLFYWIPPPPSSGEAYQSVLPTGHSGIRVTQLPVFVRGEDTKTTILSVPMNLNSDLFTRATTACQPVLVHISHISPLSLWNRRAENNRSDLWTLLWKPVLNVVQRDQHVLQSNSAGAGSTGNEVLTLTPAGQ
jgi:hypothetical protein